MNHNPPQDLFQQPLHRPPPSRWFPKPFLPLQAEGAHARAGAFKRAETRHW